MNFPSRYLAAWLLIIAAAPVAAVERVPWTTSRVHGSPEPPPPYRVVRAFPKLTFAAPIDAVTIPGTNRVVIVEQGGRLLSIPNDENCEQADPFGDLKQFDAEAVESYGIAFHPQFAQNRFAFVWLNLNLRGKPTREDATRVVRFRVLNEDPPQLDLASGQTVFSWLGGGHNGGNLRFGPDGMLYISTGDAATPDPPDPLATGQDISDVLSSVLRIDVDHAESGKAYRVPKDNPFVATPGARGEVWAYGFRNPWRLSFDAKSGALWVGDVGWELWEMIYRVERGGNYGWSITEGSRQAVRPDRPRGPTPILPPVVAHSHEEAASITGGEVYYGRQLPELAGSYIYGDWQLGTFWALRDGVVRELCRSTLLPVGFGVLPDGELVICDQPGGGLWRLVPNPEAAHASPFPRKLSDTGLFTDVAKQTPSPGVLPYAVKVERWADHATGERWIAIPSTENVSVAKKDFGVLAAGRWLFPGDTVFAKTYSLQLERGNPGTLRRVETQLLHFDGQQWAAYSYRWNDTQTDAELVPDSGAETVLTVKDPDAPGGVVRQAWRYFSRSECLRCHNMRENFTPGFSAFQLDRAAGNSDDNQLDLLTRIGLVPGNQKRPVPTPDHDSLEFRARSYLHANCATCHRRDGGGAVPSWMNIEIPLAQSRLVGAKPVQGELGLPDGRVIAAGDPSRSVLLYRMTTAGRGHMPYLGGRLVDDRGVTLVRDWIESIGHESEIAQSVQQQRQGERDLLARLKGGDLAVADNLLGTASGALSVALAVIDGSLKADLRRQTIARGSALVDPLQRDLFERFLPEEQRRQLLGSDVRPESILALQGNPIRGQPLFTALCAACHRGGNVGTDFGPDLTRIGAKFDRPKLLEQILEPAKLVEREWQLTTIELKNGESRSGFIAAQNDLGLKLRIADGKQLEIASADIATTHTEPVSVMPQGLLQTCTAQDAADLLEFLISPAH